MGEASRRAPAVNEGSGGQRPAPLRLLAATPVAEGEDAERVLEFMRAALPLMAEADAARDQVHAGLSRMACEALELDRVRLEYDGDWRAHADGREWVLVETTWEEVFADGN